MDPSELRRENKCGYKKNIYKNLLIQKNDRFLPYPKQHSGFFVITYNKEGARLFSHINAVIHCATLIVRVDGLNGRVSRQYLRA